VYGYYRGSYHIHGHIHNRRQGVFEYLKTQDRALNAGVDVNAFMLVPFKELLLYNERFKSEIQDNAYVSDVFDDE
jgi:calcineurin-like phosphoesterase family protein